jgi:dienelactone hydrolase
MRLTEPILILVVFTAALTLKSRVPSGLSVLLISLGVLLSLWYGTRVGIPWQMLPVLSGLALVLILQVASNLFHIPQNPAWRSCVSVFAACFSVLSMALLIAVPMFTLPKPTGEYPVGTRIMYMKDVSRTEDQSTHPGIPRELIVQIWYPAAMSNNRLEPYQRRSETTLETSYRSILSTNSKSDAPIASGDSRFHVLLFNHGWGGRRTQDTFLTEDLASHGYVVASIDHPYNAGLVAMPDGRVIEDTLGPDAINPSVRTAAQILNTWNKELSKWVEDDRFVLDTLQTQNLDKTSFWFNRLDTTRTGAFGHSFGGAASVQICSVDARVQAGLNMDGWTFGDLTHRVDGQSLMFIYGGGNSSKPQVRRADPTAEMQLDLQDANEVESSLKEYGGYKLTVEHTSHMDFTDHSLVFPWRNWKDRTHITPVRIQTIVRAYTLAFFDQTLQGKQSDLLQRGDTSPFHDVHMEVFTPPSKTDLTVPSNKPSGREH